MTKKQPATSDRLDAFFEAVPRFIKPYRDRMLHWLASADRLCGQVAGGGSSYEQQALFVVRLAGIVSDLRRRFKEPFLTAAEFAAVDLATQHREACRGKLIAAIAALYGQLSEDELLWLELRRHEQSHPVLDGYIPEASNDVNWDRFKSTIMPAEDHYAGDRASNEWRPRHLIDLARLSANRLHMALHATTGTRARVALAYTQSIRRSSVDRLRGHPA